VTPPYAASNDLADLDPALSMPAWVSTLWNTFPAKAAALTLAFSLPLDFGQNPPYFCTASEEEDFHRKASGYMYNEPLVERYAAFGTLKSWGASGYPSALMDSDGHITDLGRLYATAT
jgi:hypothetical protein